MPPADEATLEDAEKQQFESWFQKSIEQFDYKSISQPGYTPARRLTHSEYRHTIRDLVGVDLADTTKFPQDLSGSSGFKNSANTLFLQGSLFEKYSQSAEAIMTAVFAEGAPRLMRLAKSKISNFKFIRLIIFFVYANINFIFINNYINNNVFRTNK